MKKLLLLLTLLFCFINSCDKPDSLTSFKTTRVDKKVSEFSNELDLNTPLNSSVTFYYLLINGQRNKMAQMTYSNKKYYYSSADSSVNVSEEERIRYLNNIIKEVITYKDSVAYSISQYQNSDFSARLFVKENDKWVNYSKEPEQFSSLKKARNHFRNNAHLYLKQIHQINLISAIPQDTLSFINYLEKNAIEPKDFILAQLRKHKLVLYGDIHFRKWSWDLCREVAKDERFAQTTGTIFMELGANKQNEIDEFLKKDVLDNELLLGILRDYKLDGWDEKGKFDFMIDIWKINRTLPLEERIKIILVDTPRKYDSLDDLEERHKVQNRDSFMAKSIEEYLIKSKDKRNSFFTVGTAHICKSLESAGAILQQNLPKDQTYYIFTHSPRMDNRIDVPERIRHGVFDYAFCRVGNKPLAFELNDSPFGKEPFDALNDRGLGSYQENYDGYIFFGALDEEPEGEILFDLYSDKFILELNRRYSYYNSTLKDWWEIDESGKKGVIDYLLKNANERRWENIIEPMAKCN